MTRAGLTLKQLFYSTQRVHLCSCVILQVVIIYVYLHSIN